MPTPSLPPLLNRYVKALCHLNCARKTRRLGLILGAGVSQDLEIPDWKKLLSCLEDKLDYPGSADPEMYRAEQLFQHFRKVMVDKLGWKTEDPVDSAIVAGWRETVSSCLYSKFAVGNKLDEALYQRAINRHPYLTVLGRLARDAVLVVTHNFDDALEYSIDLYEPKSPPLPGRRYHSFWRPEPFLRAGMVNIYHPNGYTPLRKGLRGSENLVLTEGGFADHLANTNTEESHFLLRHLADKTCLIIGHSLADGTLKNALRQHANQRPAHVNYFVHWCKNGEAELSKEQRNAIREANFETYNLITIFASSPEISEIVELISMDDRDLEDHLAAKSLASRYVYYLVGAVSAGKSTALRHLRDLATVEEWPSRMPIEMNRQSMGLNNSLSRRIDKKLASAIWQKNSEIRDIKVGVVAVDRAPLDFVAFPRKKSETMSQTARERAKTVLDRFAENDLRDICPGQVIVLQAEPRALASRQLKRGNRATLKEMESGATERYVTKQQRILLELYKAAIRSGSSISAKGLPVRTFVKAVARIIHLEPYVPFDFARRLKSVQKGVR